MAPIAVDTGAQEEKGPDIGKVELDLAKKRVWVEMSEEAYQKAQAALPFYDRAMTGMQAEVERLDQQERNVRAHPILGALSRLAGNLAQQHDMPGFVRGLGMTAAELNPSADRLAMQKLPIWKELAELSGRQGIAQTQLADTALRGAAAAQAAVDRTDYLAEKNRLTAEGRLLAQAKVGVLTPERVRSLLGKDASDELVQSWVDQSKDIYENAQLEKEAKVENIRSQATQRRAAAANLAASEQLKRDQAEYSRLRTKLLPRLTEAKANELDARAAWHVNRGITSFAGVNLKLKRFAHDIEAFDAAKAENKVRIANDILANTMAPSDAKKALLEKAEELGIGSKLTVPKDIFEAAGMEPPAAGAPAPRPGVPGPTPVPTPSPTALPPRVAQAFAANPTLKAVKFGGVLYPNPAAR